MDGDKTIFNLEYVYGPYVGRTTILATSREEADSLLYEEMQSIMPLPSCAQFETKTFGNKD